MHGSPLTRIRRFQREIFGECPECLLIMDEILKTYLLMHFQNLKPQ